MNTPKQERTIEEAVENIRNLIATLPELDQALVSNCTEEIMKLMDSYGPMGLIALGIVASAFTTGLDNSDDAC